MNPKHPISCFALNDKSGKYDSELVSLYVRTDQAGRGIGSNLLIETAKELLETLYKNQQIRLVGVKLDNLTDNEFNQISMFEQPVKKEKNSIFRKLKFIIS